MIGQNSQLMVVCERHKRNFESSREKSIKHIPTKLFYEQIVAMLRYIESYSCENEYYLSYLDTLDTKDDLTQIPGIEYYNASRTIADKIKDTIRDFNVEKIEDSFTCIKENYEGYQDACAKFKSNFLMHVPIEM